jgi:hypothetical protein
VINQNHYTTKLFDVFRAGENSGEFGVFIVMEYLATDLKRYMTGKSSLKADNLTQE